MTVYLTRYRVSCVRDGNVTLPHRRAAAPADAAAILRECMPVDDQHSRETFAVLLLDVRHRATGFHVVSVGCLTSSIVHPREVFQAAIIGRAAALILCHNHPSGDPEPSTDDLTLTRRLSAAGTILGIDVLDHVILSPEGTWVSFRDSGLPVTLIEYGAIRNGRGDGTWLPIVWLDGRLRGSTFAHRGYSLEVATTMARRDAAEERERHSGDWDILVRERGSDAAR